MTYRHFKKLTKYLHTNDIEEEKLTTVEGFDVLQKVRPVLDIMEHFHKKYRPGRELVDGGFQGTSPYQTNKPTKWGFKVWGLATPHGYVLRGNIYLGKKEIRNKGMLLENQVVIHLLDGGGTATVWYDNRYICVLLTNSDPKENVSVLRKTGNERLAISCPVSIVNYTKFMARVDRAD
ncbi:hypothetical protein J437_LFUL016642 [Ladona fulva]|uniref:PiggyBac transposable element-derived protein domain-containing protein n=1 Tax=Ladona fulva TaxID=123851 RepID=A0A8K0KMU5_LADFU|nr:hypothetical protein J437_LFUL016642 [Ladona fulva]